MKRGDILDEAKQCVTVDRAATHGDAEKTFGRIAAVWSARLGINVTEPQVCILLADLKTSRAWGNPCHADNWIDIAGYAACGGEIATSQASPDKPEATPHDPGSCPDCGVHLAGDPIHAPHCSRASPDKPKTHDPEVCPDCGVGIGEYHELDCPRRASPGQAEAATASSCQCGAVYGAFHSPDCPRAGFKA